MSEIDFLQTHADALDKQALELAQQLSREAKMPLQAAYDGLAGEFVKRLRNRSPSAVMEGDARTAQWRARFRLYLMSRLDEPEADSDPDFPPEHPGNSIFNGLPAVASELARLALEFHGQQLIGLDHSTLTHRLKSLRPTLSRRGGDAVWRVPYSFYVKGDKFKGDSRVQEWLARVDVERV